MGHGGGVDGMSGFSTPEEVFCSAALWREFRGAVAVEVGYPVEALCELGVRGLEVVAGGGATASTTWAAAVVGGLGVAARVYREAITDTFEKPVSSRALPLPQVEPLGSPFDR